MRNFKYLMIFAGFVGFMFGLSGKILAFEQIGILDVDRQITIECNRGNYHEMSKFLVEHPFRSGVLYKANPICLEKLKRNVPNLILEYAAILGEVSLIASLVEGKEYLNLLYSVYRSGDRAAFRNDDYSLDFVFSTKDKSKENFHNMMIGFILSSKSLGEVIKSGYLKKYKREFAEQISLDSEENNGWYLRYCKENNNCNFEGENCILDNWLASKYLYLKEPQNLDGLIAMCGDASNLHTSDMIVTNLRLMGVFSGDCNYSLQVTAYQRTKSLHEAKCANALKHIADFGVLSTGDQIDIFKIISQKNIQKQDYKNSLNAIEKAGAF